MAQASSYVIRIYRRGFSTLEGLVEDSRTGEQRSFSKMEELWSILQGASSSPGKRQSARSESSAGIGGGGDKSRGSE